MTSDPLTFENSWPGSTIDGIPSIIHGILDLTCDPDGSVFMSLSVGPLGAGPRGLRVHRVRLLTQAG
ncbi:hypothetical protein [Micromonospora sp. NPDC005324]|uniref:hypothetical protein n=1 Tax=Micromonospora sp. NPDC005324 TaxID=3157033 RepID=UPI0033B07AD3